MTDTDHEAREAVRAAVAARALRIIAQAAKGRRPVFVCPGCGGPTLIQGVPCRVGRI